MGRSSDTPATVHVSEAELSAMTVTLDQLHHDVAMPAMRRAVSEWVASFRDGTPGRSGRGSTRRTFLFGSAGVAAGGVLLAACGSSSGSAVPTTAPGSLTPVAAVGPTSGTPGVGDLQVAALAASLENLSVYAYTVGLKAAAGGKLGKVPPAMGVFATTARSQHVDHADAWNAALRGAGRSAVTTNDPALAPSIQAALANLNDVTGLAELALLLENTAAQTYQAAIPALSTISSIRLAASIQPVEMQHAAILYLMLGRYPGIQGTVADKFAEGSPRSTNPVDLARSVSDTSEG